jgi:hypothetical protein
LQAINDEQIRTLLHESMGIYTLTKHMGTSVLMIEHHYGHVLLRKKAHQIAGLKNQKYINFTMSVIYHEKK